MEQLGKLGRSPPIIYLGIFFNWINECCVVTVNYHVPALVWPCLSVLVSASQSMNANLELGMLVTRITVWREPEATTILSFPTYPHYTLPAILYRLLLCRLFSPTLPPSSAFLLLMWSNTMAEWVEHPSPILGDRRIWTLRVWTRVESNKWLKWF